MPPLFGKLLHGFPEGMYCFRYVFLDNLSYTLNCLSTDIGYNNLT
jgi:hypothetical protein